MAGKIRYHSTDCGNRQTMDPRFVSELKKLGDNISGWIADFLLNEGLPPIPTVQKGILMLLDRIRAYAEEGKRLYPEIIITTSLSLLLQTLPSYRTIPVEKCTLHEDAFARLLKRCAPLAADGWVIYIEIKDDTICYGLVSAESSEISASIYEHLVGELSLSEYSGQFAYVRPIGTDFLEMRGSKRELVISLKFKEQYKISGNAFGLLIGHIIHGIDIKDHPLLYSFFKRLFEDTLRDSHGCIIAVIENTEQNKYALQEKCDAVFFEPPIDLVDPVLQSEELGTREASAILRSFSAVVKRMINHDGITVFSTYGNLVAYNLFFHNIGTGQNVTGGARTRAFKALVESGLFECCLFRSQDGNMELWEKQND